MSDEPQNPEFRVSRVLGRSFSIVGRNVVSFGLVALLLMVPTLLIDLFEQAGVEDHGEQAAFDVTNEFLALGMLGVVVYLLCWLLITAALVYGTFQELRGQHASVVASLSRGLARMFPVIGVAIVQWVVIMVGWLFFVAPGIVVAMVLWVAIPVAVVEQAGVIASLKRSAFLTKGYRWKLLGISILILVGQSILTTAVEAIIGAELISTWVASWVIGAAAAVIWAVVGSVAYHDLRAAKEGVSVTEIARVFD